MHGAFRWYLAAAAAIALAFTATIPDGALAQRATGEGGVKVGNPSIVRKLVSAEKVEEMGVQQYGQLLARANQQGVLLLDTHPTVQRVRRIARDLLPFTTKWNERAAKWQWEVNVFRAPTINAFCMPAGKIAFFTGIIDQLKLTDDEIAVIMGHEIAHALREHARERLAKQRITNLSVTAIAIVFGDIAGQVANAGGGLYGLRFGRNDESEADLIGMELAARGGYDPAAGITLWEKMSKVGKGQPPQWLSTHPSHVTRIDNIRKNLKDVVPLYQQAVAQKRG
jgi:Zn-dependent protease with chaperone function